MGIFSKKHSIGKTIAELRKSKGWTQAELAEKLQVSDKAVSKWEKDNGAPSIEFFPAIAELFGVSIDYIMTGKEPEREVIMISKAELCAKNDNPAMLDGIDINHKDEQGKSLVDYILQYQSFNVFVKLCESQKGSIAKFPILDAIKLSILTNRLDLLRGEQFSVGKSYYPRWTFETEKELLMLLPQAIAEIFNRSELAKVRDTCILTDDIFETIVCDKRINEDTIGILLGKQPNRQCVWYHVFPYLIHQSYLHNNEKMLRRLLALSVENNQYAYDNMKLVRDRYDGRLNYAPNFFFMAAGGNKGHGLVRILEETIKLALEKSDFALFKEFDDINRAIQAYYDFKPYIASEYEIRMAKLKADKSVTQDELTIQSTIHDGIINIDELLATKNLLLIKKALSTHDIHPIEPLCRMFQNKQWRTLFEYAVDSKNDSLARAVMKNDEVTIEREIVALYLNALNGIGYPCVNRTELRVRNRTPIRKDNIKVFPRKGEPYYRFTIAEIKEYLDSYRQQIIFDYSFEGEKIKAINDLTKEYFESELKKGNPEIVIIKLCVRLEAILRSSYHYEGDFSEMLDKYCSQHGQVDDGWGYNQEAQFVKYLQKLRMCRNSIVHAEKKKDMLTLEEIQYCIDYICNLK